MEPLSFFVQLGFGVLLAALVIVMVVALLWCNAAAEKGAYLNAFCAIVLLVACLFAAIFLADLQKEMERPAPSSRITPAASVGVLF
jgi:hypothetical protein